MALYTFWIVIVNCYLAAVLIGMCSVCLFRTHTHTVSVYTTDISNVWEVALILSQCVCEVVLV